MKRKILMFIGFMLFNFLLAQSPQSFKYQSVIRDGSGQVLQNQSVSLKISILQGSVSGTEVYEEEHSVTTNDYGLVNLDIGGGNVLSGTFSSISWGNDSYYVQIELDATGGTNYQLMGVSQLTSVPYSMYADSAGNVVISDTSATNEIQILSISNDTIYLTNGGFVVLPEDFSGDYNDLINAPVNVSDFSNDAGYITNAEDADADSTNELQMLNLSNDTLFLSDGNSVYMNNLSDTSYWEKTGDNLYYAKGNVRVGTGNVTPVGRLQVMSDTTAGINDVIFSIQNAEGDTVFAVYQEGVRIWVTDDTSGTKASGSRGGFAVGGFTPAKGPSNEYLRVTPDSVRVYIEEGTGGTKASGSRGGFAVGGFTPAKSYTDYYFNIEHSSDAEIIDPSEARMLWYPQREALLSGMVLIQHPDSVGTNSFVSGYESRASGNWSHALGYKAIARGDYSTSIGKYSKAFGSNSFAFGDSAKVFNDDSYAFGAGAISMGKASYAFGSVMRHSNGTPTNAYTLAQGDYSLALGFGAESQGFMSIAFGSRAIASGSYSMVFGYESTATDAWSMALGDSTISSGPFALAMGTHTEASGNAATTFGRYTVASGNESVAGGRDCEATGQGSVAIGYNAKAQGFYYSTAFGGNTISSGKGSFAAGVNTTASDDYAFAVGATNTASDMSTACLGSNNTSSNFAAFSANSHNNASGMMSTAFGFDNEAQAYASFVIGRYSEGKGSAGSWNGADPVFVIGNGSSIISRSNTVEILKNGEVYFKDVYADVVGATNRDLYIDNTGKIGYLSSSKKYKKNIKVMEDVSWLYNLNPVNYVYKKDKNNIKQYGLIAEEVEKVNPLFVSYNNEGDIETVQYSKLITPLLKIVKDQKTEIEYLRNKIEELENLKNRINKLETTVNFNTKK